jgi:hypothetical protein
MRRQCGGSTPGTAITALVAVPYGEEPLRCPRAGKRRRR